MATMSFLFQGIEMQKGKGEKNKGGWRAERREAFLMFSGCGIICTVFSFYNSPLLGSSYFKEKKVGFFFFERGENHYGALEKVYGALTLCYLQGT